MGSLDTIHIFNLVKDGKVIHENYFFTNCENVRSVIKGILTEKYPQFEIQILTERAGKDNG